jgi:hypothetical protein
MAHFQMAFHDEVIAARFLPWPSGNDPAATHEVSPFHIFYFEDCWLSAIADQRIDQTKLEQSINLC